VSRLELDTLDLGHNELTTLPDELGDLPNLTQYLYLSDNRITELPDSLTRLSGFRSAQPADQARPAVEPAA
jgi:Leucine-rich repeat (LRR) protein